MRASLSLMEREVVQITAARIHGCDFCIAGHSAISLKKAGQTPDTVRALQHGQPTGDAKLDAVAAFATAVIATRGAVGDADIKPSWPPATTSRRWKWCWASAWPPCAISPTAWPARPSIPS
jgi:AhpD family alkylhydroperoxidase